MLGNRVATVGKDDRPWFEPWFDWLVFGLIRYVSGESVGEEV